MCMDPRFKELEDYMKERDYKESELISVLHKAQELFGYLGEEVQNFVAEKLCIPVSKVYGVIASFLFTTDHEGNMLSIFVLERLVLLKVQVK